MLSVPVARGVWSIRLLSGPIVSGLGRMSHGVPRTEMVVGRDEHATANPEIWRGGRQFLCQFDVGIWPPAVFFRREL